MHCALASSAELFKSHKYMITVKNYHRHDDDAAEQPSLSDSGCIFSLIAVTAKLSKDRNVFIYLLHGKVFRKTHDRLVSYIRMIYIEIAAACFFETRTRQIKTAAANVQNATRAARDVDVDVQTRSRWDVYNYFRICSVDSDAQTTYSPRRYIYTRMYKTLTIIQQKELVSDSERISI